MKKKYNTLRFMGTLYKLTGILLALLTVLMALLMVVLGAQVQRQFEQVAETLNPDSRSAPASSPDSDGLLGLFTFIVILIPGLILSMTVYGFGEAMFLLLALEENTRATALFLRRISATER